MRFSIAVITSVIAAVTSAAAVPSSAPEGFWNVTFSERHANGGFTELVVEGNYFANEKDIAGTAVRCSHSNYPGQTPQLDCTSGFSWDQDLYYDQKLSLQQVIGDKTVNGTAPLPERPSVPFGSVATVQVEVVVDQAIA